MGKSKQKSHIRLKLNLSISEEDEDSLMSVLLASFEGMKAALEQNGATSCKLNIKSEDGAKLGVLEITPPIQHTIHVPRRKLN